MRVRNSLVNEDPEFPRLMEYQGGLKIVVLFSHDGGGTVVYSKDKAYPIGYHIGGWDMKQFAPFAGVITLEN